MLLQNPEVSISQEFPWEKKRVLLKHDRKIMLFRIHKIYCAFLQVNQEREPENTIYYMYIIIIL